jgi:hypothetical protein
MEAVSNYYYGSKASPIKWTVTRFQEKVHVIPGVGVRAAGCCDKCGQSIRYVYTLKSSDGRVMDVGSDCAVTLQGGPDLAEMRRAEAAYQRELYLASDEYREKCERERVERETRAARAARAEEEHALLLYACRAIVASASANYFEKDRAQRYITAATGGSDIGFIDEDDVAPLSVAFARTTLPRSKHVGQVGDKIERKVLVEALIPVETPYGTNYVQKFRSTAGESLVWFSKAGDIGRKDIGTWIVLKGTVKAHKEYNGEPQTTLVRCKTPGLRAK